MADRDPAREADPDPTVGPDESRNSFRDWCQNHLARLTMRLPDYYRYRSITYDFDFQHMPYHEFRNEMGVLLQDPNYAHLRVYWDDFHRCITGEVRLEDSPLYLFPLVLCAVLCAVVYALLLDFLRMNSPTLATTLEIDRLREQTQTLPSIVRAIELICGYLDQMGQFPNQEPRE